MLFIVKIGQSGFAPHTVSADESDHPDITSIFADLRAKGAEEFGDLTAEGKIPSEAILDLTCNAVRQAVESRQGLHEVRAIDPETLDLKPPTPGSASMEKSDEYYVEFLFLDDAAVANRNAYIDKIFTR